MVCSISESSAKIKNRVKGFAAENIRNEKQLDEWPKGSHTQQCSHFPLLTSIILYIV